jgi:hypothetical protein
VQVSTSLHSQLRRGRREEPHELHMHHFYFAASCICRDGKAKYFSASLDRPAIGIRTCVPLV